MSTQLTIYPPEQKILKGEIKLPLSKSLLNRELIIHALAGQTIPTFPEELPEDSQLIIDALKSDTQEIWCGDGGTTSRFLLAYYALLGKEVILNGSERLKQRPVKPLLDALRQLGYRFECQNESFPIKILAEKEPAKTNTVQIPANISSQFISAIAMVGPYHAGGLSIHLEGEVVSMPYLEMTLALMKKYGIEVEFASHTIHVSEGKYQKLLFTPEADWSAASYWFGIASLAKKAELKLQHLNPLSLQGDCLLLDYAHFMGLETTFEGNNLILTKKQFPTERPQEINFSGNPDLMMTFACWAAAQQINIRFTGLETLKHKESDRVLSTQTELAKFSWEPQNDKFDFHEPSSPIDTYNDHRIAMAFAQLAVFFPITINNPDVVKKSYPQFWDEMKNLGFGIAEK